MTKKAVNEWTAVEMVKAIQSGETSCLEIVEANIAAIDAQEDDVRAWAYVDADRAIEAAKVIDRTGPKGPLYGLPVGFKDVIDTADMPTEYGSEIYPGYRPNVDAACVALIKEAGGIVFGKAVTTEFAFVNPNKTRNPHNLAHTPGGSSSGSAAAVAANMIPLAFGTQTGGSVIRPASFCGVVGYKPSIGQFSYAGVKLLARSLDTLGAFARGAGDLALLRAALLGAPEDVQKLTEAPRIAFCQTPWWDRADASSQVSLKAAADQISNAGGMLDTLELPAQFAALENANFIIMMYEGRRSLGHEFLRHEDLLSDRLKDLMTAGLEIPFSDYREAIDLGERCRREFGVLTEGYDAVLVPSAVGEAPEGFETTGDALFNRPWTTIGIPCITLPNMTGRNGLPVGIQLTSAYGTDENLIAVAAWVEEILSF